MTVSTAAEAPPTTSKPSTELEATQRHADSTQQSNVTQPCTTTCDEQQSAEKQPRKHQHSEKLKQRKRKKRYVGIPLLVLAVVVVIFAIGLPKAAKDERVRAAVTDSVQRLNNTLVEQFDVSLDGFLDKLSNLSDTVSYILPGGDELPRPGQLAAKAGLRAHHPVIIIPGFVTSGLELWQGEECASSYFRQRLWGTLSMAQTLLADRACWMRHMKLDPVTGSDPPGIKLRAAKALEAVDYFVPGYWVFSKMVQSLADIGYDNNNLVAVPYDWRLPIPVMESRDGFFTRVRVEVEMQLKLAKGIKPVMVSHSYGAAVTMAFLDWVERQNPGWVDQHLHGYINVAGPILGLPKAISPLLSGETRETVDMMAGLAVLVEQYLGKQSRAAMFRTWGSVLAMLPVGGPKVWGNATHAPDDDKQITKAGRSYGGIIALVRSADSALRDAVRKNDSSLISNDSLKLLTTTLSNWGNMVKGLGSAASSDDVDDEAEDENEAVQEKGRDSSAESSSSSSGSSDDRAGDQDAEAVAAVVEEPSDAGTQAKQQVRFLDVHSALLSLAATAGAQLTINMQRWSAEAKQLNLSHILAHHHKTAVQLAEQRKASCSVDPEQPADTQGKCKNGGTTDAAGGGGGADCSGNSCDASCDSSSSSSSTGGSSHSSSSSRKTGCKGSCTNVLGMASSVVNSQFGGSTSSSGTEDSEGSIIDEVVPVNPVTTPLPKAPDFKLYCFYGIGTRTERGYHYLKTRKNGAIEWSINNMANDPASGLESGVQLSPDGDGTVPLLSLGAQCAGGWKTRRLNPAGIEVVVREYAHNPVPVFKDSRGGPGASTHVEILGNEPMLQDLLNIVAGKGEGMEEQYFSDIRNIASKIPWDKL